MNLNQIQTFLVLADTLHFGRAAQQLGVSQPAISRVLSALERQVGRELFDRTSRSIRLTPAGQGFLQPARMMFQSADEAFRAARSGVAGGIDTLRVGLMIGSVQPAVGQLIRRFKDKHPETRIVFHHSEESTLGKQLANGEIDVAVAWEASIPTGLFRKQLAKVPMSFVVPADHKLARKKSISLLDLRNEQIILPARESLPIIYETFYKMTKALGFEPKVSIDVLTIDALLAVVSAGLGIGNAPIVPELKYPGVVLRPNQPEYFVTYELVWLDDNVAVRDLVSLIE
ncbi:MAG: LysR family transcriptional regulator [Leptolyngbya sp.]|nr:LysR family transcriptional regulator [Candidatus Melainabacteria bacterium]